MSGRPDLDLLATGEIVELLLSAEQRVVPAVRAQADALAAGAELIARRLDAGGRLLLAGAGTSGRLAVAEAAELPGTFGLDPATVVGRVAGGTGRWGGSGGTDGDEDDLRLAEQDLRELACTGADTLVAVAASGRTPYTLTLARAARGAGCTVLAVVNAANTPLAALADVAIAVEVGTEVLRGSTRLTAGSAQKIALNALTTAAMARLGRVHGDLMIDVVAANAKLRARAAAIIAEIAGCSDQDAARALAECGGSARAAVLRLALGLTAADAAARASRYHSLRDAMQTS